MEKYADVSRQVRALMLDLTPQVEPISIDEAFMDLAGTARLHGMSAAKVLARFSARVEKRDRHHRLDRACRQQVPGQDRLRPRQAARLRRAGPGRGRRVPRRQAGARSSTASARSRAARFAKDGFRLIADLQRADETRADAPLRRRGPAAVRGSPAASTSRAVDPVRERKSVSAENTFETRHRLVPAAGEAALGRGRRGLRPAQGKAALPARPSR